MTPPGLTVRLAGGRWAGRRLPAAAAGTRPATARMRGSIFNRPDVLELVRGRILDLYAGAGLLGIEALSQDAAWVDFVERDQAACAVIRRNLTVLQAGDRALVHCVHAERSGGRLSPPYDLCFVDPPFDLDAEPCLLTLLDSGLLTPHGQLLWRHPWRRPSPLRLAALVQSDQRRYGDGALATYRWGGSA